MSIPLLVLDVCTFLDGSHYLVYTRNLSFSKYNKWASQVAQSVKTLPAMQETWAQFLGREDPLEKDMATHSSILAWRIPWTEEPGRLQSMGLQESTQLSN